MRPLRLDEQHMGYAANSAMPRSASYGEYQHGSNHTCFGSSGRNSDAKQNVRPIGLGSFVSVNSALVQARICSKRCGPTNVLKATVIAFTPNRSLYCSL